MAETIVLLNTNLKALEEWNAIGTSTAKTIEFQEYWHVCSYVMKDLKKGAGGGTDAKVKIKTDKQFLKAFRIIRR